MRTLRSIIFYIWMYGFMVVFGLIGTPLLLGPRSWARKILRVYLKVVWFGMRWILGVTFEVRGREHLTTGGALVASNPVGAVTTPGDRHFYAAPFEINGEFGGLGSDPASGLGLNLESRKIAAMSMRENTTIAIIATDATLTKAECQRVAVAAHDGIGRATVPAHMPQDGDLVFALSTDAGPAGNVGLIGHAAALCLARAIARAAFEATPAPGDLLPCWRTLNA